MNYSVKIRYRKNFVEKYEWINSDNLNRFNPDKEPYAIIEFNNDCLNRYFEDTISSGHTIYNLSDLKWLAAVLEKVTEDELIAIEKFSQPDLIKNVINKDQFLIISGENKYRLAKELLKTEKLPEYIIELMINNIGTDSIIYQFCIAHDAKWIKDRNIVIFKK